MKTKNLVLSMLLVITGLFTFAQNGNEQKSTDATNNATSVISWESTIIDLGEVKYNVPATAEFTFINISKEPVNITSVRSSCGCTVTDYSKEPILPGKSSTVKATYNSKKVGQFQKSVTVVTNDNVSHTLTLKGVVVE